jgi:hypothetical protein
MQQAFEETLTRYRDNERHKILLSVDLGKGCARRGYCWFILLRRCILQNLALIPHLSL